MKDETRQWLRYAEENRRTAHLARDDGLLNPCLQNCQQAVEKQLKAMTIELGEPLHRTHSIRELTSLLRTRGVNTNLSDDDCDLLDSVYLPSKYPLGSALPYFDPDLAVCDRCLEIVDRLTEDVGRILGSP